MKRFIFLVSVVFIFFGCNFSLFGQTQKEEEETKIDLSFLDSIKIPPTEIKREVEEKEVVFCIGGEQPATFEGGMDNFYKIVADNLKFPKEGKEGRVFIQFVVNKTGKVSDIKVVKGLSEENDKEALRIMISISEQYDWIPAEQRGKKIKVRMCIPIMFKKVKK